MSDDQQQPSVETPTEPAVTPPAAQSSTPQQIPGAEKKLLAGLLGIFLGWIGVHKFVLGYQKEGIILAIIGGASLMTSWIPIINCITVFGMMGTAIVGLIEGIIYLTKSDEDFVNTYVQNKKAWF